MAAVFESPTACSFRVVGIVLRAATREQDIDFKPGKFKARMGHTPAGRVAGRHALVLRITNCKTSVPWGNQIKFARVACEAKMVWNLNYEYVEPGLTS